MQFICPWPQTFPECHFTSAKSTRTGRKGLYLCNGSFAAKESNISQKINELPVMIGCMYCRPSEILWFCSSCYQGLKVLIAAHSKKMHPVLTTAVRQLTEINWDTLSFRNVPKCFNINNINPLQLVWDGKCPVCDTHHIPHVPALPILVSRQECLNSLLMKGFEISYLLTLSLDRAKQDPLW